MKETQYYNKDFFTSAQVDAESSAKEIIPILDRLFSPKSVIDIGCGTGSWLKVWKAITGAHDILGVEGPYIPKEVIEIPVDKVILQDLKLPLNIDRKYDLAMSLEVAEHLPEDEADNFVEKLTSLSDIIFFSAAIIGQEGTYHINEQMPDYWALKFEKKGYVAVDYLRPLVWGKDNKVQWWYQQNILLYIKKETLSQYPELEPFIVLRKEALLKVHPWLYLYKHTDLNKTRTLIGYIRWRLYPLKVFIKKLIKK